MTDSIVFKNAFLIDGTGREPVEGAVLTVTGGRVEDISRNPPGGAASGCRVLDVRGRTLMPGLIDAHVHPGNVEWHLNQTAKLPPAVYVHRVTRTLERDLDLGFTSLRDGAGLDPGFREAISRGLIRGPRLLLSITPITRREAGVEPEARNSLGIYPEVCSGRREMGLAVQRTLKRGADQIKVFADGEVVSQSRMDRAAPGDEKFTVDELRAAVQAASAAGSYVMAHVYSPAAIQNCLRAGVRSIEHGNLMDQQTAEMMTAHNAYWVPTLTIYDLLLKKERSVLDDFSAAKLALVARKGREALETAFRAGVSVGSGSDIIGPLQHLKGRELVLKAEVMGPMGAIVSATRTNAELMGLSRQIGTLEPGKLADLIVIDGNPLDDISLFEKALERVVLVMRGGEITKMVMTP